MTLHTLPMPMIALVALAAAAPAVQAAESYDNCAGTITSLPATITTQGVWCVTGDLTTAIASGGAITVAANNVTIDCNDFKIGGLSAGTGTLAKGIVITDRMNTTVRNCNIRGFYRGVDAVGGGGHLFEDNRLEGNTNVALRVWSGASIVRDNILLDTGGSDASTITIALEARGGTDVLDNTIRGVVPSGTMPSVYGIQSAYNDHALIRGNRLSGLVHAAGGMTQAIAVAATRRNIVESNFLFGSGESSSYGISCFVNDSSAVRNVIVGIEIPIGNCTSYQNSANPN